MEHIPESVIPEVFDYIFSHANKFVFLGICTRLAIAVLPNGENAHCTVKPIEWWADKINEHNQNKIYTHLKCYGDSNGYMAINPESNIRKNWDQCGFGKAVMPKKHCTAIKKDSVVDINKCVTPQRR